MRFDLRSKRGKGNVFALVVDVRDGHCLRPYTVRGQRPLEPFGPTRHLVEKEMPCHSDKARRALRNLPGFNALQ
jgi:hypothetical protein